MKKWRSEMTKPLITSAHGFEIKVERIENEPGPRSDLDPGWYVTIGGLFYGMETFPTAVDALKWAKTEAAAEAA